MDDYITRKANKPWTCADCGKPIPKGTSHIELRTPQTPQFRAGTRLCFYCAEARKRGTTDEPLGTDEEIIAELRRMIRQFSRSTAASLL